MKHTKKNTVRRSVALPRKLVERVTAAAPPEFHKNFNRLVHQALQEYAQREERKSFEREMDKLGRDPQIVGENQQLLEEFDSALMDGLEEL